MKVTVTKPAKTKSWNPRDRYFWSMLFGALVYSNVSVLLTKVGFFSVEYWVISIVGYLLWVLFAWWMERWVFGP